MNMIEPNWEFFNKVKNGDIMALQAEPLFDVWVKKYGGELLRIAAFSGHLEMMKFLLALGVNAHYRDDIALKEAAKCGNFQTVKYLLDNHPGVSNNAKNAVLWAKEKGQHKVASLILAWLKDKYE